MILIIIYLLFAHWVADFIFQDEKWALAKKSDKLELAKHTLMYALVMTSMLSCIIPLENFFLFFGITLVTHTIIDYFTSKWVGMKFEKKELGSSIPNFGAFSVIGLDQFIHYAILIWTLYLCINI